MRLSFRLPSPGLHMLVAYIAFTCLSLGLSIGFHALYKIGFQANDYFDMGHWGHDYLILYAPPLLYWQGLDPYAAANYKDLPSLFPASRIPKENVQTYNYPPAYIFVMAPLALMPFDISFTLWKGLSCLFIGLAIFLASRFYRYKTAAFVAGCLLYAQATFMEFEFERGQTNALIFLLVVASIWSYFQARRPMVSAFFLAFATVLKITPAILALVYLVRLDKKALVAFGAFCLLLMAVTGPDNWWRWIRDVVPANADIVIGWGVEHSLRYFFEWFTGGTQSALFPARIAAAAMILCYLILVRCHADRDRALTLELTILICFMNIVFNWSTNYKLMYLVFLFLAPFGLAQSGFAPRHPLLAALPFFGAFFLLVPVAAHSVTRLAALAFSGDLPNPLFSLQEMYPLLSARTFNDQHRLDALLTDRKACLGVLAGLLYTFAAYTWTVLRSRPTWPWFRNVSCPAGIRDKS